jgi:DNA-binding transcriptional ArsR family regulator
MRPLFHPALEDVTVEALLHALSDPVRAAIFLEIAASSSPKTCSTFLTVKDRDIPKSTLSQHFKVLREAGLIRSERQGVEMRSTSRCREIDKRFPGLIAAIVEAHARQRRLAPRQAPAKAKGARRAAAS